MPKPWTKERLQGLTTHELQTLYGHAREKDSPEADDIIELIFQHKLLEAIGGGMSRDHPTIQAIEKICRSVEGIAAGVSATRRGEAAIAGVDPILRNQVREYGYADTTSWAGTFVAEEMEAAGLLRKGRRTLPANCIAKTAAFFVEPAN